jgi:type I restriction enzyme S subunit
VTREPWPTRPLIDLCDRDRGITYGIVKVGDFVPGGIPVIRGGDVRNGWIAVDHGKRVSRQVSEQFRRTILRGGEVVMNLIAEPGHAAVVPHEFAGYNVSRDVAVIPLRAEMDSRFVSYFLRSQHSIDWLVARLQGSVTQKINLATLRDLPLPTPPLRDQQAVSDLLGAFDDKIEQNRRLADTATRLVELIFAHRCTAPPTDQRAALTTIAEFVNGGAFTKHANGAGRPIIRIKELNDGVGESTPRTDHQVRDENIARHHDLLFSWSGSLNVYRWDGPESIINQHIFKVIPRGDYPSWFVEAWLRYHLSEFQAIAREKATTMGHIKRQHLDDALVDLPDAELLAELDESLSPLDELRGSLRRESRQLTAVRDALLPRLVSGQIRVRGRDDRDDVRGTVIEQAAAS